MSTTLLLIIGGGLGLVLIMGAGIALLAGGNNRVNVDERLDQFTGAGDWEAEFIGENSDTSSTTSARDEVADRIDKAISGRNFSFVSGIKTRLAKADLKLRVSEYLGLIALAAAAGAGLGYFVLGSGVMALVGGVVGLQAPRIYANYTASNRLKQFEEQLSDTLNLWVNALRSGFSVLQAMEAIATELPAPVSKEFERVIQEVRLGIDMDTALANALRRLPSEDFDLVVTAVSIQREVGGNLAEILDIISFTIRERVRIKGEIRTLTAQGRASGWVITFLPIALGLALFNINREYIMELFRNDVPYVVQDVLPCGWLMVGIASLMIIIGGVAIQKIVDIEV